MWITKQGMWLQTLVFALQQESSTRLCRFILWDRGCNQLSLSSIYEPDEAQKVCTLDHLLHHELWTELPDCYYDVAIFRRGDVNELPLLGEYVEAANPHIAAILVMAHYKVRFAARVSVGKYTDRSIWRKERVNLITDEEVAQ